ncbi:hypothetical protein K443DRAFT_674991 [Laccaria amethystina LaAM-08-1]|uniref:Uncharacterized protein n=1 Tax=Laccaria amethystina LaAM-08-1 TaxID=1095629 RepID=A0A0C9XVT2_9AGAR|nr:hypothetical protein K443DRAFT_674991 [Laccaria amethystina LaAM-08-1]
MIIRTQGVPSLSTSAPFSTRKRTISNWPDLTAPYKRGVSECLSADRRNRSNTGRTSTLNVRAVLNQEAHNL